MCTTLWCRVNKRCLTRLEAAAEGTKCGDNLVNKKSLLQVLGHIQNLAKEGRSSVKM